MSETNATEKPKSKLDQLMEAQLTVTGADIPEGSYGATLFEFSEPFEMDNTKGKFFKQGDPAKKVVFEASFGIYDKAGQLQRLDHLLPWPDGGAANRRSNLYKMLGKLAAGTALMKEDGSFASGTTLKSFIGRAVVVSVKKNAKEFPVIEGFAAMMDGVKKPDLEACKTLERVLEGDGTIPF
jgi:hypothetical protein